MPFLCFLSRISLSLGTVYFIQNCMCNYTQRADSLFGASCREKKAQHLIGGTLDKKDVI